MALLTNIVGYWKLNGNSNDSVSTNNGTDTAITYSVANGKIVQGAGFNGTSSKIFVNSNLGITGVNDYTISHWVKVSSISASATYTLSCIGTGTAGMTTGINLTNGGYGLTGENIMAWIWNGTDVIKTSYAVDITDGLWHLLTSTLSGTTLTLYLDGSAVGTPLTRTGTTNVGSFFYIGSDEAPSNFTNGTIDEVGVWSRALTQAEITEIYNGGAGLSHPFTSKGNFFQFF